MPVSVVVTAAVACLLLVSLGIAVVSLLFPFGGPSAPGGSERDARRGAAHSHPAGATTPESPARDFFIEP